MLAGVKRPVNEGAFCLRKREPFRDWLLVQSPYNPMIFMEARDANNTGAPDSVMGLFSHAIKGDATYGRTPVMAQKAAG